MKRTVLLFALLICTAIGFAQNSMPFILKYAEKGDSSIYHNVSYLEELRVDHGKYEFRTKNYDYKRGNTNLLDTIFIFQDHFKHLDTESSYWDDIVCSTEQIYFYKEDPITSKPKEILLVAASDTIPNGVFNYIVYDDNGIPSYINFNNEHYLYVERIYDHYADAIVLNNDSSFVSLDSIDLGVDFLAILNSPKIQSRSGYTNSNLQNATALLNHLIGGAMMAEGGIALLTGCAMLIPGVNIAAGATIAIAGAATFIAGGLLTARATDQLVSDGSHTEGFDTASNILGAVGTMGASGGVRLGAQEITSIALDQTWNAVQQEVDRRAEFQEAYERTKHLIQNRLTTLQSEIVDVDKMTVRLYGNITRKIAPNDFWGLYIAKDKMALTIEDCLNSSNDQSRVPGIFSYDFSDLEQCATYYYRAYYYASEFNRDGFNPYFVANVGTFTMPGVKTLNYTPITNTSYDVRGKVFWIDGSSDNKVGICFSETHTIPTIEDCCVESTQNGNGTFTIRIEADGALYYYRAYAIINGVVKYGDVEILTNERKILEQFYVSTGGDNWINNENWCTDAPLSDWYGVSMDGLFVNELNLISNNLSGNGVLRGLKVLHDVRIENNNMESITIEDCPNFQIQHHWLTEADQLTLKKYKVANTGHSAAYVGFNDIFDAVENGYTCYYTHENWLGNSHIARTIIDEIYIDHHFHRNQTFFKNLTAKLIDIRNVEDFGRIFFDDVTCENIYLTNCKFNDQGVYVGYDSQISNLVLDNCYIPSGSAFGDCNLITISNSFIGGLYISNFSGTQEEFNKYMEKLVSRN